MHIGFPISVGLGNKLPSFSPIEIHRNRPILIGSGSGHSQVEIGVKVTDDRCDPLTVLVCQSPIAALKTRVIDNRPAVVRRTWIIDPYHGGVHNIAYLFAQPGDGTAPGIGPKSYRGHTIRQFHYLGTVTSKYKS